MVIWCFGAGGLDSWDFPYERDCYLEVSEVSLLLMVQKSQTTTWDVFETLQMMGFFGHINWLAGFLNHQQYPPKKKRSK